MQHIWSEINHDIGYKSDFTLPTSCMRSFSRLASLMEIAYEMACNLRNEISDYLKSVTEIVRAAANGKPVLGVGIVHSSLLEWCTDSATDYNIKKISALQGDETSCYMDGSDGWDKLKAACSDA